MDIRGNRIIFNEHERLYGRLPEKAPFNQVSAMFDIAYQSRERYFGQLYDLVVERDVESLTRPEIAMLPQIAYRTALLNDLSQKLAELAAGGMVDQMIRQVGREVIR